MSFFTLFDPAKAGTVIFHDLMKDARYGSIDGFGWKNPDRHGVWGGSR
jgi:hypothetical protein